MRRTLGVTPSDLARARQVGDLVGAAIFRRSEAEPAYLAAEVAARWATKDLSADAFAYSFDRPCRPYCRAISASPIPSPSRTWSSSMVTVTLRRVPVKVKGAA
jgi:hypothetical protein